VFANKENTKGRSFLRRPVAVVVIAGLAASMAIGMGISSASASTGVATNTALSFSNNQAYATNVTETTQFTTATTAIISQVRIAGPTAGTPAVGMVYGIGAGTVTPAAYGFVYTLTTPVSVAAGTPIYIEVTGLTNPGAGSNAWGMDTWDNASTPLIIDHGANTVVFGSNNTAVTVQVAKSLTFTNDTASYTMLMDPSLAALSDQTKAVTLTVKTNAGQGYSLAVKDTGMKTAGTGASLYTIPGSSAAGLSNAAFASNTFGFSAALATPLNSVAALAPAGLATAGNFIGFTTAGVTLLNATKPTGNTADSVVLTNRAKIDYTTPAGTYTDTITYTATPAY
jgi:hypothetical protein